MADISRCLTCWQIKPLIRLIQCVDWALCLISTQNGQNIWLFEIKAVLLCENYASHERSDEKNHGELAEYSKAVISNDSPYGIVLANGGGVLVRI